jgi:hypothetical protein
VERTRLTLARAGTPAVHGSHGRAFGVFGHAKLVNVMVAHPDPGAVVECEVVVYPTSDIHCPKSLQTV